jgi:hypothetical protein
MPTAAAILLGVAALAHLGFMAIEMFPWKRPLWPPPMPRAVDSWKLTGCVANTVETV